MLVALRQIAVPQHPLLPSAVPRDECVLKMQFRSLYLTTGMTGLNGQPAPLPVAYHEQPRSLGPGDSVLKSADRGPSTQPPWWSQPLSIWPLTPFYPPLNADTHSNTRSIPSFTINRYFILAFLICLFAFLLYIFPSLLYIFSFRKY